MHVIQLWVSFLRILSIYSDSALLQAMWPMCARTHIALAEKRSSRAVSLFFFQKLNTSVCNNLNCKLIKEVFVNLAIVYPPWHLTPSFVHCSGVRSSCTLVMYLINKTRKLLFNLTFYINLTARSILINLSSQYYWLLLDIYSEISDFSVKRKWWKNRENDVMARAKSFFLAG